MWYLAHGSGVDDIAMMVAVIVIGLLLLRRSERSVRTRAEDAETDAASVESVDIDPSENDSNSV